MGAQASTRDTAHGGQKHTSHKHRIIPCTSSITLPAQTGKSSYTLLYFEHFMQLPGQSYLYPGENRLYSIFTYFYDFKAYKKHAYFYPFRLDRQSTVHKELFQGYFNYSDGGKSECFTLAYKTYAHEPNISTSFLSINIICSWICL